METVLKCILADYEHRDPPRFDNPVEIGHFSLMSNLEQVFDNSQLHQLKMNVGLNEKALNVDLNDGFLKHVPKAFGKLTFVRLFRSDLVCDQHVGAWLFLRRFSRVPVPPPKP